MYDGIAKLIKYTGQTFDKYGNPVKVKIERTVFVMPRGVYSSEFYDAAQLGLKPSVTLTLSNRAEYKGEKILEYEGVLYNVIRVDWNAQRDAISLVCEERAGDGPEYESESESESESEEGSES